MLSAWIMKKMLQADVCKINCLLSISLSQRKFASWPMRRHFLLHCAWALTVVTQTIKHFMLCVCMCEWLRQPNIWCVCVCMSDSDSQTFDVSMYVWLRQPNIWCLHICEWLRQLNIWCVCVCMSDSDSQTFDVSMYVWVTQTTKHLMSLYVWVTQTTKHLMSLYVWVTQTI